MQCWLLVFTVDMHRISSFDFQVFSVQLHETPWVQSLQYSLQVTMKISCLKKPTLAQCSIMLQIWHGSNSMYNSQPIGLYQLYSLDHEMCMLTCTMKASPHLSLIYCWNMLQLKQWGRPQVLWVTCALTDDGLHHQHHLHHRHLQCCHLQILQ